jgi:hypothetical protein
MMKVSQLCVKQNVRNKEGALGRRRYRRLPLGAGSNEAVWLSGARTCYLVLACALANPEAAPGRSDQLQGHAHVIGAFHLHSWFDLWEQIIRG